LDALTTIQGTGILRNSGMGIAEIDIKKEKLENKTTDRTDPEPNSRSKKRFSLYNKSFTASKIFDNFVAYNNITKIKKDRNKRYK
jgi:hypothetical protein